ncbi:MAG: sigma-70 family RNA polymerase sigma factor [Kofleriaceae bacterium]|nr:sigma-70 family RNA polymerase sigma factor [Kofleriaceae bacterium]
MPVAAVEVGEAEIRKAWETGDLDAAMTRAFERYADELYGFLRGLGRDPVQADEAFSAMCERIWRGLPNFRWDSTFRVWAYRIARNEFLRTTREVARARRAVPLSDIPSVKRIVAQVRSTTPPYQRDDVRDKFAAVRAQLPPDDLVLLGMRIEHKMAWDQIALVLAGEDAPPTPKDVAALRKRFERLKTKLRGLLRDKA